MSHIDIFKKFGASVSQDIDHFKMLLFQVFEWTKFSPVIYVFI